MELNMKTRMNKNMVNMIKVGPARTEEKGSVWDEKGRCQIAKIFVSHEFNFVTSLQFLFVENGEFILSDRHGVEPKYNFATVVLDYPSEYLTWISGTYYRNGLRSITFGTNKGSHGPYGGNKPLSSLRYSEFKFQIGDDPNSFGGFHGTKRYTHIESIGIYVKAITSKDHSRVSKVKSCFPKWMKMVLQQLYLHDFRWTEFDGRIAI